MGNISINHTYIYIYIYIYKPVGGMREPRRIFSSSGMALRMRIKAGSRYPHVWCFFFEFFYFKRGVQHPCRRGVPALVCVCVCV
jgi:hypothetical protein